MDRKTPVTLIDRTPFSGLTSKELSAFNQGSAYLQVLQLAVALRGQVPKLRWAPRAVWCEWFTDPD